MDGSLFKTERTDANVLKVFIDVDKVGWSQDFLVRSDAHHDNPNCIRKLEMKHLDQALQRKAGIIDIGDLHDCMEGKWDPRADKERLLPQYRTGNYLDAIVNEAAKDYAPYAKNWLSMGYGNHETAMLNRHETDLTQRLAAVMNSNNGSNIQVLGYTGWVRFIFKVNGRGYTYTMWYTHGMGGAGQAFGQMNHQQMYIESADILLSGHNHRSWMVEGTKHYLGSKGRVKRREMWCVKIPTYKDGYQQGVKGFEVEKGHGPRPLGAYWIQFYLENSREGVRFRIIKAD